MSHIHVDRCLVKKKKKGKTNPPKQRRFNAAGHARKLESKWKIISVYDHCWQQYKQCSLCLRCPLDQHSWATEKCLALLEDFV